MRRRRRRRRRRKGCICDCEPCYGVQPPSICYPHPRGEPLTLKYKCRTNLQDIGNRVLLSGRSWQVTLNDVACYIRWHSFRCYQTPCRCCSQSMRGTLETPRIVTQHIKIISIQMPAGAELFSLRRIEKPSISGVGGGQFKTKTALWHASLCCTPVFASYN
jgi:hypothetical protein